MTVKELRALLAKLPGDSPVLIQHDDAETGDRDWYDPNPIDRILHWDRRAQEWSDVLGKHQDHVRVMVL